MDLFNKWKPLYAPEMESGIEEQVDAPPPRVPNNEAPVDGPGSGRGSIRRELEKNTKEIGEREAKAARTPAAPAKKPAGGYQSRATEMRGDAGTQDPAAQVGEQPEVTDEPVVEAPKEAAPEAWSKEAKAAWATTPPAVRAAALKREQDVAVGVQQLRNQYAEIDQVLGPRADTIKRHGHTPAQAINQLFSWFDALGQDVERVKGGQQPQAFIALAKSFGLDKLMEEAIAKEKAGQGGQQPAQQAQAIAPEVQKYITDLESRVNTMTQQIDQRLGGFEQNFQQQNAAKTQEILGQWSKDKEHYAEPAVRQMMAQLLQSGAVPALPDGRADLDGAYDAAIFALPAIRQKVLESKAAADKKASDERVAAERKLQTDAAIKARRATGSLAPGAPGTVDPLNAGSNRGKGKGRSVRDSLMGAIDDLSS